MKIGRIVVVVAIGLFIASMSSAAPCKEAVFIELEWLKSGPPKSFSDCVYIYGWTQEGQELGIPLGEGVEWRQWVKTDFHPLRPLSKWGAELIEYRWGFSVELVEGQTVYMAQTCVWCTTKEPFRAMVRGFLKEPVPPNSEAVFPWIGELLGRRNGAVDNTTSSFVQGLWLVSLLLDEQWANTDWQQYYSHFWGTGLPMGFKEFYTGSIGGRTLLYLTFLEPLNQVHWNPAEDYQKEHNPAHIPKEE